MTCNAVESLDCEGGIRRAQRPGMSRLIRVESIFALLSAAHRVRIALEDACAFDEYVFHELTLMRALAYSPSPLSGIELAHALGWSGGRVSTVTRELVAKGKLTRARHANRRCRAVALSEEGHQELRAAQVIIDDVASPTLETFDDVELASFAGLVRRVAEQSTKLWRHRAVDAID